MNPIIPVVFDHPDFLVVNKPCDVPMHDKEIGICNLLCSQLSIAKLYLVHRLDSATSGCLLLAKNKPAAAALSGLFATRQIDKYYLAISDRKPKKKQGKIVGDMKKSRNGSYILSPAQSPCPQAITFFMSQNLPDVGRVFFIKPISGKTHQIRVALKSMGSAILGDIRYKGTQGDRLYLHCSMLVFRFAQKDFTIECKPLCGQYFTQELLNNLPVLDKLLWPKYTSPQTIAPQKIEPQKPAQQKVAQSTSQAVKQS